VTSTQGLSLDRRFQIWMFNLISRFFGMFIKGFVFLVFLFCFFVLLIFEVIIFFVWLFFPALIVVAIFWIFKTFHQL
jgi:hypothetical protein